MTGPKDRELMMEEIPVATLRRLSLRVAVRTSDDRHSALVPELAL